MERLNKVIAASGVASRRKADQLIEAGKVSVNGKVIKELGVQVDPGADKIVVEGKALPTSTKITYLVNKPVGVVCSKARQKQEKIITDLVPASPAVYPVGRLDKESGGLILLTNDGDLAFHLSHPSFEHAKEYRVHTHWQADKPVRDAEWVQRQLLKGVRLGDGLAKADKIQVWVRGEKEFDLVISVHEGRQHLIRRMCASVGLDVITLVRTKYAGLTLEGIGQGHFRVLTQRELKHLHAA